MGPHPDLMPDPGEDGLHRTRLLEACGDFPDLRAAALDALRAARAALRASSSEEIGEHTREVKSRADEAADAAVRAALSRTNLPILSEEAASMSWADQSGVCWVVDPLDGTVNYMRGLAPSRISIALCAGDTALYGLIGDAAREELTEGGVALPLKHNAEAANAWRSRPLRESIVLTGFPAGRNLAPEDLGDFRRLLFSVRRVRLWGSAAASLEAVALGHADGYIERQIGFWDVAAGLALLYSAAVPFHTSPLTTSGRIDVIAGCALQIFPA